MRRILCVILLAGLLRLDEMKLVWRKLARRTGKED